MNITQTSEKQVWVFKVAELDFEMDWKTINIEIVKPRVISSTYYQINLYYEEKISTITGAVQLEVAWHEIHS